MRRDKVAMLLDILEVVYKEGKAKPTHIMYKANLSHKLLKSYISELESNGILEEENLNGKRYIKITNKGKIFLSQLRKMRRFMESFGL
ncbi:MAG TPA: hypothetical protein ENG42_01040 [Candidatus Aenigmarchaeota archaeon]|nr:MAG: hypothetical protein DRP03_03000 [Candidatus Aenigmarchaeota archaeon]HDD46036.1 hypothetical protein [Candidatus Aenigmarchaeota archaeon]